MNTAVDNNAYGTTAEMAFLNQLAKSKQAATLLRNYIAAAPQRSVWGSIDKTAALLCAQQLLNDILGVENYAEGSVIAPEATKRLAA